MPMTAGRKRLKNVLNRDIFCGSVEMSPKCHENETYRVISVESESDWLTDSRPEYRLFADAALALIMIL